MKLPLLLVVLGLGATALAAPRAATAADGASAASSGRIAAGSGWLSVRTGLSFGDLISLDDVVAIQAKRDAGASFGVGFHYRTARLDLGVDVEHLGSFRFAGVDRLERTGGQFRAVANVRWRYVDAGWGALFLRLAPGLMVYSHADALRAEAGKIGGGAADDVDAHTLGFTLGFDFGGLITLSDRVALAAHLDIVTGTTRLGARDGDVDYTLLRGLFSLGIEWRM